MKRLKIKFILQNVYLLLIAVCLTVFILYNIDNIKTYRDVRENGVDAIFEPHLNVVDVYFAKRQDWNTSNLGSRLFKNELLQGGDVESNKTFKILVWKYQEWLLRRHVLNFSKKRTIDPLAACDVKNCVFFGDDKDIQEADAVLVHIQRGEYPKVDVRNTDQRWIFLSDESPHNAFSMAKARPKMKDLANVFNWSMTYRSDSDVPVPYGRTVPSPKSNTSQARGLEEMVPFWRKKSRHPLAAILISNCGVSRRMDYLKELKKHLSVDVHGKCSDVHKNSCPGHFRSDCAVMARYLFYLVFENSACEEYITEKGFYHAYSKGAIPIIMGPTQKNCELLLPPDSFLHIENYDSAKHLADHVIDISEDADKLMGYHKWRYDFEITNEHGYFGSKSFHYCRICEALNYNDKAIKVYGEEDLRRFLDPNISCR